MNLAANLKTLGDSARNIPNVLRSSFQTKPDRVLMAKVGAAVAFLGAFLGFGARAAQADTLLDTLHNTTLITSTAGGISAGISQSNYRIPLASVLPTQDCLITNITTVLAMTSNRLPSQVSGFNATIGALSAWQSTDANFVTANTQHYGMNLTSFSLISGAGTVSSPALYRINLESNNNPTFLAAGGTTSLIGITVNDNNGDVGLGFIQETLAPPAWSAPTVHARVNRFSGGTNNFDFYGQGAQAGMPFRFHPMFIEGTSAATSAPEPGTVGFVALGGAGLLGLKIAKRRRKTN